MDAVQLAVDIVDWLGFIDVTDRQEFMSRERHEGTCKWIFNRDVCERYHEWWSAREGFLWIRGKGMLFFLLDVDQALTATQLLLESLLFCKSIEFLLTIKSDFWQCCDSRPNI